MAKNEGIERISDRSIDDLDLQSRPILCRPLALNLIIYGLILYFAAAFVQPWINAAFRALTK